MTGGELSWSAVAEMSFTTMLDELDQCREIFGKVRKDATLDEVGDLMLTHFNKKVHALTGAMYAQVAEQIEAGKAQQERSPDKA